ncbi:MAG TPA: zinc-binding dehydrogenase, partial [Fimbriimonadaceae bacterium]|nr:zinc-binding dehydrogenase [Fimbriimonadaceae bacterium]
SADLVGTRVVSRVAHASEAVTSAGHVYPYPPEIPAEQAAWFALGMIGFMGAKAGGFGIGHEVLVVGGGPIGQMAVRWAAACGAETIGLLDPVPMRLMLGTAGGANRLLELVAEGAAEDVREAFGGELPGTVVDATGHAAVFEHCLALPRRLGKLVLLGDTGDPSQQRLTPDVVRRGIQVHGAHVTHEEGEWTEGRIHRLFFELIRAGRFPLQNLITHRFAPEQAPEAYELTTTRRSETMGVLFDWGYGS